MFITLTSSKITVDQARESENFLDDFLPRLKHQPGVMGIYHFQRPDKGDEVTVIVWENEEAMKVYREGELIKEPIAFESLYNIHSSREGYPLIYAVSEKWG